MRQRHGSAGCPLSAPLPPPGEAAAAASDGSGVWRRGAAGVQTFKCTFAPGAEETIDDAMQVLKQRGEVAPGQLLAIVQSGRKPIWNSKSTHNIQVPPSPHSDIGLPTLPCCCVEGTPNGESNRLRCRFARCRWTPLMKPWMRMCSLATRAR